MAIQLPPLQTGVPIVTKEGAPAPAFQRRWQDLTETLKEEAAGRAQLQLQLDVVTGYLYAIGSHLEALQAYHGQLDAWLGWLLDELEVESSGAPSVTIPAPPATPDLEP